MNATIWIPSADDPPPIVSSPLQRIDCTWRHFQPIAAVRGEVDQDNESGPVYAPMCECGSDMMRLGAVWVCECCGVIQIIKEYQLKTIIAGCRHFKTTAHFKELVKAIEESGFEITEVVSGGAAGVDIQGEMWAAIEGVPLKIFLADWDKYGKAAGPIRNGQMANYADALIAVWDGKSSGTKNMIDQAKTKNLKVHVHIVGALP